jgi:hypoxanthine phosphoribosyltransferase
LSARALSVRIVRAFPIIVVLLPTKRRQVIQVLDKTFELYIDAQKIGSEVKSLAEKINEEYAGKELVFVAVLNGAFMFASDLMKCIRIPVEITFVKVSSYKGGMHSTGRVDELIGLNTSVQDKHVIILEDIIDTGITIEKIRTLLQEENPASVKVCALLYKPEAFQGVEEPDYVGFSIPNAFVVGYGLDYNEKGRNLDAIYQIQQ